jgi:cytochrome c-type biogenesis protein CcmH/NrfG
LSQALSDSPRNAVALARRGQAYEAQGRNSHALDDFRAALDLEPNLDSAKEGFARIMTQQQSSHRQP